MSDSNPSAASHRDAARRRALSLPVQMLLGLGAGVALGAFWPSVGGALQPIGTAFIEAIKMVVIPLIFSAVTLGIYKMGQDVRQLGRVSLVAFGWFFFASFLAILIGVVLDRIFQPGVGAGLTPTGKLPPNLMLSVDWAKYFVDFIPSNVVAAMAGQKVLPTIVFSVLFGLALATMGERSRPIVNTLEALLGAMFTLTKWIVGLAPLAVFAIMAWIFATQGAQTLFALARLIGVLYLGLFILVCIFWAVLLAIGENPLTVTRKVLEPVLLSFTTRSSEVSLPVHMEKLEAMGVPNRTVSIVLPLGYSFNLDGAAMYMALAVTFLAEAYGITLSWSSLATILLTTWIASKGLANVPSGSLVALATVLTAIGLPVEAIAIIAGVDAFMDMGRTAINVYGNTVAVLLVQKFGGVVDDRAPDDGSTGMIVQGQAAQ